MSRREGKDSVQQGRADSSTLRYHASEMLERICEVETPCQMLDEVAQQSRFFPVLKRPDWSF